MGNGKLVLPGILNDKEIEDAGILEPFEPGVKREGVISYGVSHFGYDIRVANKFKIFSNVGNTGPIDPKNVNPSEFFEVTTDRCIIPPNSYALAESIEHFHMPEDVIGVAIGKSTYARCGIICNVTPLEPCWQGILTIEISNATPRPAIIYANEGIAQVLFFESDEDCETSYADKKGKYQAQTGVTLPIVNKYIPRTVHIIGYQIIC